MRLAWIVGVLLAACHADVPVTPDAAPGTASGDATSVDVPEPITCTGGGAVKASAVTLQDVSVQKMLTLDGVGTRCEQLQRAILDPAQRPAEIAAFDVSFGLQPPLCAEFAERTNVAITVSGLLGQPLLSSGQYVHVWVDNDTDTLEQIRIGWFIVPPPAAPTTCAMPDATLAAVTGHEQDYSTFQLCAPTGGGTWTVQADDPRSQVGEGLYFDGTYLSVVREIDVEPHPGTITQQLRDSDLNCFGRVAIILIVDAETGKVVDQRRHCIVC